MKVPETWKRIAEVQFGSIPWAPACMVWIDVKETKRMLAENKAKQANDAYEALKKVVAHNLPGSSGALVREDGDGILLQFDSENVDRAVELAKSVQKEYVADYGSKDWHCAAAGSLTLCQGQVGVAVEMAHSIAIAAGRDSIFLDQAARDAIKSPGSFSFGRKYEISPRDVKGTVMITEIIWDGVEHGLRSP
jgi:class 3 adenylate cyclase